jgi:hypothetical protein
VSEQAAAAVSARPGREATITDADLHRLFPASTAEGRNAIALVSLVKVLARGRRSVVILDSTLLAELGWSKRTLMRAKATAREAGFAIAPKQRGGLRTGGCEWVLDRRWLPKLRDRPMVPAVAPHGASGGTTYVEENPSPSRAASPYALDGEGAPPRGSPATSLRGRGTDGENEREPERAPPPAAAVGVVDELRQWLERRRASEPGADPVRLLEFGKRWLTDTARAGPVDAILAARELAAEMSPGGLVSPVVTAERSAGTAAAPDPPRQEEVGPWPP